MGEFMCRCSDESREVCDDALKEARAHIEEYAGPISDIQFIDSMLYVLSADGDLSFESDQWGAISYELYGQNPETRKYDSTLSKRFSTQCDSFVDGLARVYNWKNEQE